MKRRFLPVTCMLMDRSDYAFLLWPTNAQAASWVPKQVIGLPGLTRLKAARVGHKDTIKILDWKIKDLGWEADEENAA